MKIAVLGYGNLGKSVEKYALEKNHEIVGIFSRRSVKSEHGGKAYKLESFPKHQTDIAALCFGSASDMIGLAPVIALHCNTVDAFDNHAEMKYYHSVMDEAAKCGGHAALIGCGWDTGVFSVVRGINCMLGDVQGTFWGKGISQGHSNALREVKGVLDGVQFTLPDNKMKTKQALLRQGAGKRHKRVCYIAAEEGADRAKIVEDIVTMPGYFAGFETEVNFADAGVVAGLKNDTSHRGEIVCFGKGLKGVYRLELQDNCYTTAKIMVEYAAAALSLTGKKRFGAYTALDIAPSEFLGERAWEVV